MVYHVVKYSGTFGFIKPWTAVRDGETFSQQFLTPSTLEGIEKKLFPELLSESGCIQKIARCRLNYCGMEIQQERTWSKGGFRAGKKKDSDGNMYYIPKNLGIINRGILLYPDVYLAFRNEEDARRAFWQTICLCRNEDLLFPEELSVMEKEEFDKIPGFEWIASEGKDGFKAGYNRFDRYKEMFGTLSITGNPIRNLK